MNTTTLEEVKKATEAKIFSSHGVKMISLGSYCLDFKQDYVFLGFTKKGDKVILGEITMIGPNRLEYNKRYGTFEVRENAKAVGGKLVPYTYVQLTTDGHRYSETILEHKGK